MDIGTGKDIADYTVENITIKHHLIDILEAGEKYNVFEFQKDFLVAYNDIISRGKMPILCGGTGMYIQSILSAYELHEVPSNQQLRDELEKKEMTELIEILSSLKQIHNSSDLDSKKRIIRAIEIEKFKTENSIRILDFPKFNYIILGIDAERQIVKDRISKRLKERLETGMIDEVKFLLNKGITRDDLVYYGLEYKFVTQYLCNEISYDEMFSKLEIAIHQFSKRQMTWFRRMEKHNFKIFWLNGTENLQKNIEKSLKIIQTNGNLFV
jgi:tRNA dimethylallyltransferase